MTSAPRVAIIDYGVGNHMSVVNALALLGVQAHVTDDRDAIASSEHIILPGVGAFREGMEGLRKRKLHDVLAEEALKKKKNILGICLGMQLLASEGHEHGHHAGLGFIPGTVRKIDTAASGYCLPHMGWNNVRIVGNHSITRGFDHEPIFYFVHSYHFIPEEKETIAGVCDYGHDVVALIQHENVFGAQFHPEKSHDDGMVILRNFLELPHA